MVKIKRRWQQFDLLDLCPGGAAFRGLVYAFTGKCKTGIRYLIVSLKQSTKQVEFLHPRKLNGCYSI